MHKVPAGEAGPSAYGGSAVGRWRERDFGGRLLVERDFVHGVSVLGGQNAQVVHKVAGWAALGSTLCTG